MSLTWPHFDTAGPQARNLNPEDETTRKLLQSIQGNLLKGHGRDYARFILIRLSSSVDNNRKWLHSFAERHVTSALEQYHQARNAKATREEETFATAMLSATGFAKLGWKTFPDGRYSGADKSGHWVLGMRFDINNLGARPLENWDEVYAADSRIDLLVQIARGGKYESRDESLQCLHELEEEILHTLTEIDASVLAVEEGSVLRDESGHAVEHFGYRTNLSQPQFFRDIEFNNATYWNDQVPLAQVLCDDNFGSFGAYVAFAKLEQDVDGFCNSVKRLATHLDVTEEEAAARIMGRFRDGRPLDGSSAEDNNFVHSKCPLAAHIRRMNPRGDTLDCLPQLKNNEWLEKEARIARRSMSYGGKGDDAKGMLFMGVSAGIDTQFYTLAAIWANNPNFLHPESGLDGIMGQSATGFLPQGVEQNWNVPGESKPRHLVSSNVTYRGGEYFWVPSMDALKGLKNSVGDGMSDIDLGLYTFGNITPLDRVNFALRRMDKAGTFGMLNPNEAEQLRISVGFGNLYELCDTLRYVARDRLSLSPISKYHTGIAALGETGAIYLGSNIEIGHAPLTNSVHAESSFAAKMMSNYAETALLYMACTAPPCGYCRQFLVELVDPPDLQVRIADENITTLLDLMPNPFTPRDVLGIDIGSTAFSRHMLGPNDDIFSYVSPIDGDENLFTAALEALNSAWSPYTKSPSAVAIRTLDGQVFSGAYIESVAYSPSVSPLMSCIANMVAAGLRRFGPDIIKAIVLLELPNAPVSQAETVELLIRKLAKTVEHRHMYGANHGMPSFTVRHVQLRPDIALARDNERIRMERARVDAEENEHFEPTLAGVALRESNVDMSQTWVLRDDPNLQDLFADIQGNILQSHGRDHTRQIFFRFGSYNTKAQIMKNRKWLAKIAQKYVTSQRGQFQQIRRHRVYPTEESLFGNLMLAAPGYAAVGWRNTPEDRISHFWNGMMVDANQFGAVPVESTWLPAFKDPRRISGMIHLARGAADGIKRANDKLDDVVREIEVSATAAGVEVVLVQRGDVIRQKVPRTGKATGGVLEHFGNRDNVSNPRFIGPRPDHYELNEYDEGGHLGLVLLEDPYGSYGSYCVYMTMQQDVEGYHSQLELMAQELGVSKDYANALVVGRFADGTPLQLHNHPCTPEGSIPENNFHFNNQNGSFDPATAGRPRCPFAAHIRTVNPRGDTAATRPAINNSQLRFETYTRVARRGIAYGDTVGEGGDILKPRGEVGLHFMAMQHGIESQFFVQQWIWGNNPNFAHANNGMDTVIGMSQTDAYPHDIRQPFLEPHNEGFPVQRTIPSTVQAKPGSSGDFSFHGFVTNRGGEFFFLPSISALKSLMDDIPDEGEMAVEGYDRTPFKVEESLKSEQDSKA